MDYVVTALIYLFNRWWLLAIIAMPLAYFIFYKRSGSPSVLALSVFSFLGLIIVLSFFLSGVLSAPVIHHFGKLGIGYVTASEKTMFFSATYKNYSSVRARLEALDGETQQIRYWDMRWRVYPVFEGYGIPTGKESFFVAKYMPIKPSEFVFIAKFSEGDKKRYCPQIKDELAKILQERKLVDQEVQHLQQSLFGSLSEEETDARLRKIRRAKDLDEAEQRFKALSEKRDYLWLKRDYLERLLYGDNFCEE